MLQEEKALNERLEQLAADNGWDSLDQFLSYYDKEEVREQLVYDDVLEYLLENVQINQQ